MDYKKYLISEVKDPKDTLKRSTMDPFGKLKSPLQLLYKSHPEFMKKMAKLRKIIRTPGPTDEGDKVWQEIESDMEKETLTGQLKAAWKKVRDAGTVYYKN